MIFRSTGVGWWARSYSIFRCLETQNLQGTLPFTGIETIQKRSLENGTHFITELSMLLSACLKSTVTLSSLPLNVTNILH